MKGAGPCQVLLLVLLCTLVAPDAQATSIRIPPWQTIIADADFIGIVECEVAGGIAAKYRVVESWKGLAPGSRVTISRRVDIWEPQYPLALCGERFLVAADSGLGSWALPPSPGLMNAVPVWWRRSGGDLHATWSPTPLPLNPHPGSPGLLSIVGRAHDADLSEFKADVMAVLRQSDRAIELEGIRAVIRKDGRLRHSDGAPPCTTRACEIARSDSLEWVIAELLRVAEDDPRFRLSLHVVFGQAGRRESLRQLEQLPQNSKLFTQRSLENTLLRIRVRLGMVVPPPNERDGASASSRAEIEAFGRTLHPDSAANRDTRYRFMKAFEVLSARKPAVVARFLETWRPPTASWADSGLGYVYGSYFAFRCDQDRGTHLRTLLKARDPYIRVAAGVYLSMLRESDGLRALREFCTLPGDAGAWAALTLARRGEKSAIPRAMELLLESAPFSMAGVPHRNLQKRLIELLSNSSRASGIELPLVWNPEWHNSEEEILPIYGAYVGWWLENASRITLTDPWLKDLATNNID